MTRVLVLTITLLLAAAVLGPVLGSAQTIGGTSVPTWGDFQTFIHRGDQHEQRLDGLEERVDAPGGGSSAAAHGQHVDSSTTGPRVASLEPSDSITTTHDGQVIEGLHVDGRITIAHDDVTVRDTKVTNAGGGYSISYDGFDSDATGATIEYVEVDGTGNTDWLGVVLWDFRMSHTEVKGHQVGVQFGDNSTIEHSYVHSQATKPGSHNDALITHGSANTVIRGNNLQGSTTAALALFPRLDAIEDALVVDNHLDGGSYCTYAGYSKEHRDANHDIRYVGNTFGRGLHNDCGKYGPVTNWNGGQRGNEWRGNTWAHTGDPVTP